MLCYSCRRALLFTSELSRARAFPRAQVALFDDVALVINNLRYCIVPIAEARGAGLEEMYGEQNSMIMLLKNLQKKKTYDGVVRMITVSDLDDDESDSESGSGSGSGSDSG